MDEHTVNRIRSLENSINHLRKINESDILRESTRKKNRMMIGMYVNEIYDNICNELENSDRRLNYQFLKYIGEEEIIL